jgi:hypothetical protein
MQSKPDAYSECADARPRHNPSRLDLVFAPEHVVDFGEVVRSRREIVDAAFWCEVLFLVGLFT